MVLLKNGTVLSEHSLEGKLSGAITIISDNVLFKLRKLLHSLVQLFIVWRTQAILSKPKTRLRTNSYDKQQCTPRALHLG